jgi:hypothetical protein
VRFIVVGGGAAIAHGLARITYDVAIVYARDPENIRRLTVALQAYQPYLRGAPPGLPFRWDEQTIHAGLNFTLTTSLGDLDLLGEIAGGGSYESLLAFSEELTIFNVSCRFVTLERLIQLKRAAGRPKDLEVIAEFQALLEERRKQASPAGICHFVFAAETRGGFHRES